MAQTILYLVRHGQTQWNVEHRMQGWGDSPLSELGQLQATWGRDEFKATDFAAIYSSDSPRAFHTAEIIRGDRQQPITQLPALRELSMGTWEGKTVDEIKQETDSDEYELFWKHPQYFKAVKGGESFEQLQQRTVAQIKQLIQKHPDQRVLIVSHTIAIKSLLCYFLPLPLDQLWQTPALQPVSLSKVIITDGVAKVESIGDASYHQYLSPTGSIQTEEASKARVG